MSTGVGPVGFYTSVGGRSRPRAAGGAVGGSAAASRRLAAAARAAQKQQAALELVEALRTILDLHRQEFAPATRPLAPVAAPVDADVVRRRHRDHARAHTSVFARGRRRAALAEADHAAAEEVAARELAAQEQQRRTQHAYDLWWEALSVGDTEVTLAALAAAFEDNEAAAAAVGMSQAEVSLVVVVPSPSIIPERRPVITDAGNLSLKPLTKGESADLYKAVVYGHLIATVREALAVAPALESARVVAVRASDPDAYGHRQPQVLATGRCTRAALNGVRWQDADALQVFTTCFTERSAVTKGPTAALQPMPLDAEPELAQLVSRLAFVTD
jgi:hypothetical protein